MTSRAQRPSPSARQILTDDTYWEFVQQIRLSAVWLESADVANNYGPELPTGGRVRLDDDQAKWEKIQEGFRAKHRFTVRLEKDTALAAEFHLTLATDFESRIEMTDALFATFKEVQLRFITWPYLREFLGSMTSRMNWLPLTMPMIVASIEPVVAREETPLPPSRRRKSKPSE